MSISINNSTADARDANDESTAYVEDMKSGKNNILVFTSGFIILTGLS